MSTPDELEIIKARWENHKKHNALRVRNFVYFSEAYQDISYLLNRLEAAEKAARGIAMMHGHKLKDRDNDWK